MESEKLVSIVLAVYNGEKYLEGQIKSILSQDYPHIELIIVDDKSQDGSLRIAKKFAGQDGRVKIFENPQNLGIVANFLKGVSFAEGDFICFSDQDDHWRKDKIKILKELIEKNDKNMLAYSDIEICDNELRSTHHSFWKAAGIQPRQGHLKEKTFLRNITPGCSMMFRRQVGKELAKAPRDIPFMHDHLALVLSSCLGNIVYSKEKLVKYRQHDDNNIGAFYESVVNKEKIIDQLRKKIEYFKNGSFGGISCDISRLESFCDCLNNGNIFSRLSYIDYYLFLRNDTVRDKTLGFVECLMPGAYKWLRGKIK